MIARVEDMISGAMIWAQIEAMAAAQLEHDELSAESLKKICSDTVKDGTRISELRAENLARHQSEQEAMERQFDPGELES
jgi:hypothetical protein